jgi:hypothetical protein
MAAPNLARSVLQTLAKSARSSPAPLELVVHAADAASPLHDRLDGLAREIEEGTGGAIRRSTGDGVGPPARPALSMVAGSRCPVHYLIDPRGPEEAPFVDALFELSADPGSQRTPPRLVVDSEQPVDLLVFVADGCPHCPHAVSAAVSLAVHNATVTVSVVDAFAFADLASRFGVRSVPTTVIDRELTMTGVVPVQRLIRDIEARGHARHEQATFASMLESGRFAEAAERLLEGRASQVFLDLWRSSSLQSRIGLVLAAEEALDRQPDGLQGLAEGLLPALRAEDAALRGDTADLLGRLGAPGVRSALEQLLVDPDPEVVEAAEDALERLG